MKRQNGERGTRGDAGDAADAADAGGESTARHPIAVVSARTGLTPDVLRVWERRYGAIVPARTTRGQRLYTDADVERLVLLRRATQAGRSVGQVAQLGTAELAALVTEDEAARAARGVGGGGVGAGTMVDEAAAGAAAAGEAFELALALRPDALAQRLRRALGEFGAMRFLDSVLAPLFRRLGDGWHAGTVTPAHEHLATAVARRVLDECVAMLAPPSGAPRLVVATPAGDRHEIGALLVAAAAAEAGWSVTYLGPDLPAAVVAEAARQAGARSVAVSSVYPGVGTQLAAYLETLRSALPAEVSLLVGGAAALARRREVEAAGALLLDGLGALRAELDASSAEARG